MAALHEELIEGILLRLPVKSLLRFKSASKKCYSLITEEEEFAKHHLKQSSSSAPSKNSLYFYGNYESVSIFQFSEEDEGIHYVTNAKTDAKRSITGNNVRATIKQDIAYGIMPDGRVVGSANGLICIVPWSGWGCCFLWNPFTGDSNKISLPVTSSLPDCSPIGFGYDSYSDDYKIVGSGSYGFSPMGMAIFSLKENSWTVHDKHEYPHLYYTTFFNGAFHWCIQAKIVAFDLAKEEFFHMELPEETKSSYGIHISYNSRFELFVWLGSLCLSERKHGSLWMMKEYGIPKSWAKLATDHVDLPDGFPIEKLKDLIPHQESLILPKYFIKDQLAN